MKKYIKISLFILAGLFFGYWLCVIGLTIWDKSSKSAVWSLIPADAVAVWQLPNAAQNYKNLDSTAIWKNLKTSPTGKLLAEKANILAILAGEGIAIDTYLQDKSITISLHSTAKGNFDFIYFIPISVKDNTLFRSALENILARNQAKIEQRNYQGIEIQEVKFPTHTQLFSYAMYKGYFVGSFTSFLLEETIRNMNELGRNNFYTVNKTAFKIPKPNEKEMVCYFNSQKFPTFLQIFYKDSLKTQTYSIENLQKNGFYQIELDKRKVIFNGTQNIKPDSELALFTEMKGTACDMLPQFLPKKTAFLYRVYLDNPEEFFNRIALQNKIKENTEKNIAENPAESSIINSNYISFSEFVNYLEGEIAVASLEPVASAKMQKVLYLKVKQPLELSKKLENYAKELASQAKDTLFFENYNQQKIIKLNYAEFPKHLFGDTKHTSFAANFAGFPSTYFTFINNYLLLGNSPKAIASVLADVENEQVWAKIYQNSMLLRTLEKPSSVCYVANIFRAWNIATEQLNPTWQQFFEEHKRQFLRFEFAIFQTEIPEEEIANSQISLLHKDFEETGIAKNARVMYETSFYNTLLSKPFVVLNPIDKSKEVLVQDVAYHLHLLAVNGKKIWHFPVGSPITKQVYQVDIADNRQTNGQNNKQTNYLFAAQNKLFLVDRKGQSVANFPVELPNCGTIEFLSLIDYDNSKNYRFAAIDTDGNLFLVAKNGQILQGFEPKKLAGQAIAPLAHIRTAGKDALLAMSKEGIINLLKRNAESYANFPVGIGTLLTNYYFIQQNIDFPATTITFLSTQGEIITLNLLGKLVARSNLERPLSQSIFKLVADQIATTDYIFSRQDDKIIVFFDKKLKYLFQKEFGEKTEKIVQYFNFGANIEIIAVTNTHTQKLSLYYLNGDVLCENLESEQEISLFFNETKNEFLIYSIFGNRVFAKRVAKM